MVYSGVFLIFDLLLCFGVFVAFAPSLVGGWVFDDWAISDEEPEFKNPLWPRVRHMIGQLRRPWKVAGGGRTFTYLIYHLTYKVFGFRPAAWHGINLLFHAGAAVILFHLAAAWSNIATAGAVAYAFAFHPLQVSSVAYISGRPNVQSLFLTLAGLLCFQRGYWPVSVIFQYLAWRSKEDSILYLGFYPICYFLFMRT